jgi:hypothetical protein
VCMVYADISVSEKLTCNHALTHLCDRASGVLFRHTFSVLRWRQQHIDGIVYSITYFLKRERRWERSAVDEITYDTAKGPCFQQNVAQGPRCWRPGEMPRAEPPISAHTPGSMPPCAVGLAVTTAWESRKLALQAGSGKAESTGKT